MLGNDESQRKKKEGERMEEASAVDVWDTDAGRSWARSQTSEGAAPSEPERWGKQPWPDPNLAFSNRYLVALLLLCCSEICKRHNLPTHVITSHQSNALTYCNGNTVKRPLYQCFNASGWHDCAVTPCETKGTWLLCWRFSDSQCHP